MYQKTEIISHTSKLDPSFIAKAFSAFNEYKGQKAELENRVRENNIWYKSQYWNIQNQNSDTEPATAFIFNAIENKYADAVDNFPEPSISERCISDEQTALILSKILPLQLEMCNFKSCYKNNWRRKLKHGTAIYGLFYNEDKEDIDICIIDILNIYCDMHIADVQQSPFLFITSIVPNEQLKEDYPAFSSLFDGDAQVKTYSGNHTIKDRTEIIDCYYKKRVCGRDVLHLMKLCAGNVIDATEDRPDLENGLYEHGLYPVIFDPLYPEDDCPFGFGVIDIVKNPQIYIDKLDGVISKNAVISGKIRYMIKDNGGINEEEVCDYSTDIIHVAGSVDESNIRQFQANGLNEYIITHRQNKISELKEIVGNRDFQQGGTYGGVTAASAIANLQQTGQKATRSIIDDSFDAFKKLISMMIELMREFYTEERVYRICDESGNKRFEKFSGNMLYHDKEFDNLGFEISGGRKKAEFDITITPKKQNPLTKESNNQTLISLWQAGFFKPENLEISMIILKELNFDGKERMLSELESIKDSLATQLKKETNNEQQIFQNKQQTL